MTLNRRASALLCSMVTCMLPFVLTNCGQRPDSPAGVLRFGIGAVPGRPGYAEVTRGVDLAIERLNAASTVRFARRAPSASATSAVQVAQELSADAGLIGVVGHPESGATLETLPIYGDAEHDGANGVVAISPTASSPRLSGVSPWFFRVAPNDVDAARVTARWALDSLGARRAAIVYRNDSYGRDWSNTFGKTFTKDSATIVAREPYLAGLTEWDAYAQLLAKIRPDVILFPGDADDAIACLRALKAAGVTAPFIGGDGTELMNQHEEAVGTHFVAFFRADRATSPEAVWFLERYRARFHKDPDMFAALAYDATIVMGRTIISGARTRTALRLALEKIGNGAPSVDGVAGRIAFERNHDIKGRNVVLVRIDQATIPMTRDSSGGALSSNGRP